MKYLFKNEDEALGHLLKSGFTVSDRFYFFHPQNIEPSEKDAYAMFFLMNEYDYGHYVQDPTPDDMNEYS